MTRTIISLTKEDLLNLIEKEFPKASKTMTIATLVSCGESDSDPQQQCLIFNKELAKNLI